MSQYTKNQVLELNKDRELLEISYKKGQKFIVAKIASELVSVHPFNTDGTISKIGYSMKPSIVESLFNITNTKYSAPKSKPKNTAKKGMIFEFNQNFTEDDISYPEGTRVIIIKGGANPEFFTNFTQEKKGLSHISGFRVNQAFVDEYFTPAEPIVCELTKDFSYKGLKEGQGEETRNFYCEICFNKKQIGSVSNDGQGGSHRIHIYKSPEWDALLKEAYKILQKLQVNEKESYKIVNEHDVDEIVADYLCGDYVGLINLNSYLNDYVK